MVLLSSFQDKDLFELKLNDTLEAQNQFIVAFIDINNLDIYNKALGVEKGDELIKFVAHLIQSAHKKFGFQDDFLGYLGEDDFVVITRPQQIDDMANTIINDFNNTIPLFYDATDRKKGFITIKDENNAPNHYPFASLSIVAITNEKKAILSSKYVYEIHQELIRYTKKRPGSNYLKDRRSR
jgi:GGDEF domain-containing protein